MLEVTLSPRMHSEKATWRYREKVAVCKPGREDSSKIKCCSTWSWTSSLLNCEKIDFYCLSLPVCDMLLGQPNRQVYLFLLKCMYIFSREQNNPISANSNFPIVICLGVHFFHAWRNVMNFQGISMANDWKFLRQDCSRQYVSQHQLEPSKVSAQGNFG